MTLPPHAPDLSASLSADRWGARWAEAGVQLFFADDEMRAVFGLRPDAVAALASQLTQAVCAHEAVTGTLWSEAGPALGPVTDSRLHNADTLAAHPVAGRLYRLVRNLPLTGFEQSFKMLAGQLWSERFLVGLSTTAIAPEDVIFLASDLGMPPDLLHVFQAGLADATFVHAGFEQGDHQCTYKLYLEFAPGTGGDAPGRPLYVGYKWNPENAAQQAISRYTRPAALDLDDMLVRVTAVYGGTGDVHEVCRIAHQIIRMGASRTNARALLFVEVREDGTPRLSFDINLYETGLRVRDLAPLLAEAATHFAADSAAFSGLMALTGEDFAGHLSGGRDRSGRPFLTLYHARPASRPDRAD
ncbi:MAG: hypothetical protein Q7T87_01920 [Polaromonas sp.]|nr:hypothetical protein [Polaromonas sp.]